MAGSDRAAGPPGAGRRAGYPRIGVLALQGAFREHARMLGELGASVAEVRLPEDLDGLEGLVIPGGESTTMGILMEANGLMGPLRDLVRDRPVLGTCAGLIMLATRLTDGTQPLLGVIDAMVRRNAFGRQTRSFEAPVELCLAPGSSETFPGVFIRAPWVEETGPEVEVIARYDERIVGIRQGHIVAFAFHPELGTDTRLHRYFLDLVKASH